MAALTHSNTQQQHFSRSHLNTSWVQVLEVSLQELLYTTSAVKGSLRSDGEEEIVGSLLPPSSFPLFHLPRCRNRLPRPFRDRK